MGWAHFVLPDGREGGYAVCATCDFKGCEAKIDRGLDYACGGMHGENDPEWSCANYFCGEHGTLGLCKTCLKEAPDDYDDD